LTTTRRLRYPQAVPQRSSSISCRSCSKDRRQKSSVNPAKSLREAGGGGGSGCPILASGPRIKGWQMDGGGCGYAAAAPAARTWARGPSGRAISARSLQWCSGVQRWPPIVPCPRRRHRAAGGQEKRGRTVGAEGARACEPRAEGVFHRIGGAVVRFVYGGAFFQPVHYLVLPPTYNTLH
jgi:hypothetical protein